MQNIIGMMLDQAHVIRVKLVLLTIRRCFVLSISEFDHFLVAYLPYM